MDEQVSAADASREFSRLLRGVCEGNSYTVTSHGRPVARIVPVAKDTEFREQARRELFERLQSQPVVNGGRWTRNDLYDD